jgi:hypothetical protein
VVQYQPSVAPLQGILHLESPQFTGQQDPHIPPDEDSIQFTPTNAAQDSLVRDAILGGELGGGQGVVAQQGCRF